MHKRLNGKKSEWDSIELSVYVRSYVLLSFLIPGITVCIVILERAWGKKMGLYTQRNKVNKPNHLHQQLYYTIDILY